MINFALIGTGYIAKVHAKAINSIRNTKLVAVRGGDKNRTEKFARKYNIKSYIDYDELLKDNEINAVDIVTVNSLHANLGIKAAKAGKHVLVEKPIDISLDKAEKLIKACKDNNVKLSVISHYRLDKSIQLIKKQIDAGLFGNLNMGNVSIKWNRSSNYYESSEEWRKKKATSGGGVLMIQAIHYIDLLLWFFGDVESVYGKVDTKVHNIEGEDVGLAVLKFKSGAIATVQGTTAVVKTLPDIFEIHGDKGSVVFKRNRFINKISFLKLNSNIFVKIKNKINCYLSLRKGTIKDQIENFVDSIELNKQLLVTGEDGKKALEVVLAIYKSSKLNKEINLK